MKSTTVLTFFFSFFLMSALYAQETLKKTALLWDSSYGMEQKDLATEFAFLDSYFNRNPNVELQLLVFSNTVIQNEKRVIKNGDWASLKSELAQVVYDGASSFAQVFPKSVNEIILVSDGVGIDAIPKTILKPVYVLNSVSKINQKELELLAASTGGAYFDMAKIKEEVENNPPITNVTTRSNQNESALPKNNERESLGEVLITKTKEKEELVNTGNAKIDKKKLGYSVETISSDAISQQDIVVEDAIRGQFSNFELPLNSQNSKIDLSQFLGRHKGMTINGNQHGLVVIDGVPLAGSDSSIFNATGLAQVTPGLDPDNIASVTYLKGLAATNKYGTLGAGGVLLITTKSGSFSDGKGKKKKVALGTTASYTGDAGSIGALPDTPYIFELKKAADISQAYDTYLEQRKIYGNTAAFYINTASYFKDWNNPLMVQRILSNVAEVPNVKNSSLLAMAYKYQELDMANDALVIYDRLMKNEPNTLQHYRNMALAQKKAQKYAEALVTYNKMDKKSYPQIAASNGLRTTLTSEFKNLVALHKNQLTTTYIDQKYLNNTPLDTRIVFEWNVFDAPFDLQIVNPQNRFFTWSHTAKAEGLRMTQEKTQGYGLEEFFMTASDKGEWLFNVTYFGENTQEEPVFLKVTTYTNYGKPSQKEEIKVIPLQSKNTKQTVLTVRI